VTSTVDGDVAEGPALGPVATARLAKVALLQHVVVTDFGVNGASSLEALHRLVQPQPRQTHPPSAASHSSLPA
jgi:hypothetical protein